MNADELPDETEQSDSAEPYEWNRPDFQLQLMVELADAGAATDREGMPGIPVTLLTPAGLVSGTIISYQEWAEAMVVKFTTGKPDEVIEPDEHEKHVETARKLFGLPIGDKQGDLAIEDRVSIHLKDVRMFTGNTPVGHADGLVMRIRLSQVAGWMLGTIGIDD